MTHSFLNHSPQTSAKVGWLALLFSLVLLVSIVVHLPAAWVMNFAAVKTLLQQQSLQVNSVQGSVWSGSANLSFIHTGKPSSSINNILPMGNLSWKLSVWSLLALQAKLDMDWQYQSSNIKASVSRSLLTKEEVNVNSLNGQLDLAQSYVLFEQVIETNLPNSALANLRLLKTAQGQLDIDNGFITLNSITDTEQANFSRSVIAQMNLQASLSDFQLMGNTLPKVEVNIEQLLAEKQAEMTILSQAENWNLQGEFTAQNWQVFSGELNVRAKDSAALPDWVFTMQKKTDTHYFARF